MASGENDRPTRPLPGLTARAVLERVVDGDTIDVSVMLPFRIRLLDCWAPETHGPAKGVGNMAKSMMQELVPRGTRLMVHIPTEHADSATDIFSFGRVLGEVWRDADAKSLSELMVETGFASKDKPQ